MGANPHSRLVPLYNERTLDGHATYINSGYSSGTPRGIETTRVPVTPQERWQDVSEAEAYENGHSYSGDFGSKHGMELVASAPVSKAVVAAAGRLVERVNAGEDLTAEDEDERAAISAYGRIAITAAAEVYDDKWGPAVGFAGIDWVWFGGWCPS